MTHSLHRQGTSENLKSDYVVFAMSAKEHNDAGSASKMRQFMELARKYNPVNMGDMKTGNCFSVRPDDLTASIQDTSIVHAVFCDPGTVADLLKELQEADLGVSIVVSGLLEPVREMCCGLGLHPAPHTVEHSLGVWGKTELLPSPSVLELSTMCGHGMVAFSLIEDAVADVRAGRTTVEKAARRLAEPCACGIFNPARAAQLIMEMAAR